MQKALSNTLPSQSQTGAASKGPLSPEKTVLRNGAAAIT
jgi:hypothetical protein